MHAVSLHSRRFHQSQDHVKLKFAHAILIAFVKPPEVGIITYSISTRYTTSFHKERLRPFTAVLYSCKCLLAKCQRLHEWYGCSAKSTLSQGESKCRVVNTMGKSRVVAARAESYCTGTSVDCTDNYTLNYPATDVVLVPNFFSPQYWFTGPQNLNTGNGKLTTILVHWPTKLEHGKW